MKFVYFVYIPLPTAKECHWPRGKGRPHKAGCHWWIQWDLVTPYGVRVTPASGNDLLPNGTKPSLQPMLSHYQLGLVAFSWGQFSMNWSIYRITTMCFKITYLVLHSHLLKPMSLLKLEYSGEIRSMPWLQMPSLLVSPGHQQHESSMRMDLNDLYNLNFAKW